MKSQIQTNGLNNGPGSLGEDFQSRAFAAGFKPLERSLPAGAFGSGKPAGFRPDWKGKRLYDVCFSIMGLILLAPLFLLIAALVKAADGGDIFYRQARVGRWGRVFLICKFRSMVSAAEISGPSITRSGDDRVTWIGRILRKSKLDELPQLWNVLKGDMSLVGPRPEVPGYVRQYTREQRAILRLKPGITDLASLCFRDEEELLANAGDLEEFYVQQCIPRKLRLNQDYAARANLLSDTWIILQTVCPFWVGVLLCYSLILAFSFWFSYQLTFNFAPPGAAMLHFGRNLGVMVGLQLACLLWCRQCRGLLSYFNYAELRQVATALGLAACGLAAWWLAGENQLPLNVIFIDGMLSLCLLGGLRFCLRRWRERAACVEDAAAGPPIRVGIIGAGSTGALLASELSERPRLGRRVVAFFDDDFCKWQKNIHDVPVVGMPECLLDGWARKVDEVVVAMPDAGVRRIDEIKRLLGNTGLTVYTVSNLGRYWERRPA